MKMIQRNPQGVVFVILLFIFGFISCKKDSTADPVQTSEQKVESALDAFVISLQSGSIDSATLSNRIKTYLQNNPSEFFGSTVTMLDSSKLATYSPYWYRSGDSLLYANLAADTAYHINSQSWLRQPIDGGVGIWTAPYFDAGGGNIWMKTRAVPVRLNGNIVAVATTDLAIQ